MKSSKKLFDRSLEQPTENSVAQAAWVSRQHSAVNFDVKYLEIPNTYEARSWTFYRESQ